LEKKKDGNRERVGVIPRESPWAEGISPDAQDDRKRHELLDYKKMTARVR